MKVWNKTTFSDIHVQVKEVTDKVDLIQAEIDSSSVTDELINQEKNAQIQLEKVLEIEET